MEVTSMRWWHVSGGWHPWGWYISGQVTCQWGVTFLTSWLVMEVTSMNWGQARAKVSSSLNHGLLENYLAPFSKSAKKCFREGINESCAVVSRFVTVSLNSIYVLFTTGCFSFASLGSSVSCKREVPCMCGYWSIGWSTLITIGLFWRCTVRVEMIHLKHATLSPFNRGCFFPPFLTSVLPHGWPCRWCRLLY